MDPIGLLVAQVLYSDAGRANTERNPQPVSTHLLQLFLTYRLANALKRLRESQRVEDAPYIASSDTRAGSDLTNYLVLVLHLVSLRLTLVAYSPTVSHCAAICWHCSSNMRRNIYAAVCSSERSYVVAACSRSRRRCRSALRADARRPSSAVSTNSLRCWSVRPKARSASRWPAVPWPVLRSHPYGG